MKTKKRYYDIIVISFSRPSTDGRTLNFVKSLIKLNKSVCLIAQSGKNTDSDYGFDLISIPDKPKSRVYAHWFRFTRAINKIMKGMESGLIVAEDLYSLPSASRAARRQNTKLIYDSREIYSALGPLSGQNIKQSILTLIERRYVSVVSEFIISGKMDEKPLRKHFKTDKPFHLILNLPPFREYIKSDLIRERFGIASDTIIILYQGEILPGRGLDLSIRAISHVERADLCIIGSGPYLSKLKGDVKRLNLGHRVHFTGEISYDKLHRWTCSADIGLALFESITQSYELALPNKLFEYCMALKPTICSDLPAMREVISEYNIGETFDMALGAEELALRIRDMAGSERLGAFRRSCGEASRQFCYESQEEKIGRIIDGV